MSLKEIHQVVILGSGNVATQLSSVLKRAGLEIIQVYSREIKHAKTLAEKLGCNFTDNLKSLNESADLYILCVSDDALSEVINNISIKEALIVHTSGTTSIRIFDSFFNNYGVFYPLQTFSKEKEIDFINIPICIEANTGINRSKLVTLAKRISGNVQLINSDQRKTLHIAAVFASNFTNYFYLIANEILAEKKLSFDLIKPLITEVASKIIDNKPKDVQTGPAKRGDNLIISAHLDFLNSHPEYQELYKLISTHIKEKFSNQ